MPVLAGHEGVVLTTLVDRDAARARALADAYGVKDVLTDVAVLDSKAVDAVVLATPPAHHAPATIALATKGLHLFVEKPMATSLADARAMVAAADAAGVQLSVGLYRRMLPSVKLLRSLIAQRTYGGVLGVDMEEGGSYGWQLATLDLLTKERGGGGVLIDIGSHVIDLLLSVLPGKATLTAAADNARGGIETDSLIRFDVAHDGRVVPVRLELSRTRDLRNSIRVRCERATIELKRAAFIELLVHADVAGVGRQTLCVSADWPGKAAYVGYDAFRAQIDDFVESVATGSESAFSGRSVLPVVGLIEDAYAQRTDLDEPWTDENFKDRGAPAIVSATGTRPRVLVTGAGGFLGGRTSEILNASGDWRVVAMVREPKGAARLARWPMDVVLGDISSPADLDRVMRGCDSVVHCAVGTSWKAQETRAVTVDGTRNVAQAAARAGVRRLVHISTMNVHKRQDIGETFDERTPLEPPAVDDYGKNKLAAEQALRAAVSGALSAIILRPTRIYGPFSKTFTVRPLQALAQGRFAVGGDPDVPANMVYVDNVVDAIARALTAPARPADDNSFLITDPEQLTLRGFYEFFGQRVGGTVDVVAGPSASAAAPANFASRWIGGAKTIVLSPEVRGLVRRILETEPIGTWPRHVWDTSPGLQARALKLFKVDAAVVYRPTAADDAPKLVYRGEAAKVSSARAMKDLGYAAPVSLDRALALTLAWAEYARLVPVSVEADGR